MPIVAEVYRLVNDEAQPLVRCAFEVPPQAGDDLVLPGNNRVKVLRASHTADGGQPLRMQYAILVQ